MRLAPSACTWLLFSVSACPLLPSCERRLGLAQDNPGRSLHLKILDLMTSAKTLFPKVTFTVTENLWVSMSLGGGVFFSLSRVGLLC